MAGKQHSKRTSAKSLKNLKPTTAQDARGIVAQEYEETKRYSKDKLAEIGRRYLEISRLHDEAVAERQQRQAEADARIAQEAREGITLRGPRLDHAQRVISQLNIAASSIDDLANAAGCSVNANEAEGFLTAITEIAKSICRRADVLAAYLGDEFAFGNYADEFKVITPEEAERIEAEKREAA